MFGILLNNVPNRSIEAVTNLLVNSVDRKSSELVVDIKLIVVALFFKPSFIRLTINVTTQLTPKTVSLRVCPHR